MPKCLMNVDAFLEGCRKLGVEKVNYLNLMEYGNFNAEYNIDPTEN